MVHSVSMGNNPHTYTQQRQRSTTEKFAGGALGGGAVMLGTIGLDYAAPKFSRRFTFLDFSDFKNKKIEPFFKKVSTKNKALMVLGSAALCGIINCFSKDKKKS